MVGRIEPADNVTNLSLASSLIIGGLFAHFQPHKTAVRRLKKESLISVVLPADPSYKLNQFYAASALGHHRHRLLQRKRPSIMSTDRRTFLQLLTSAAL